MIDRGRAGAEVEADMAVLAVASFVGGTRTGWEEGPDAGVGDGGSMLASNFKSPKSPKLGILCGESGFGCCPILGGGVRCRLSPSSSSSSSISDPDSETVDGTGSAAGILDGATTRGEARLMEGRLKPFEKSKVLV